MKVFDNNSVQLDFDEIQWLINPIVAPLDYTFNATTCRWEKVFDDLKYSSYYSHLFPKLVVDPSMNFYLLFDKDTPILVRCVGFEDEDELNIFKNIIEEATEQLTYESTLIREKYDEAIKNIINNWTGEIEHAE